MEINVNSLGLKLHSFEEVKERFFVYITDPKSREKIEEAYNFANEAHKGQVRKSGEPYIHHLIEVCYILAEIECGPSTLIAGLLHDVVEDTNVSLETIKEKFGDDVMNIVDSLTKIQRMKLSHRTEKDFEAEDHKKIFLGMARDVRVILVKLADRLHNLRTLDALKPERQHALAQETLDVFTPICHRLGIYKMQSEMEDLSIKYLEPEKYNEILALLNAREEDRQGSLDALRKRIADLLFENKIKFRIESRIKSIYSIYRKMYLKHYNFDELYDILAVRIITDTVMNCYAVLGAIHATYKPVPGRFKDYIAMPKPNMYQSLHTTVIGPNGSPFEIQIRTYEMHRTSEYGIAAHWKYKESGEGSTVVGEEEKLSWLREILEWQQDISDNKEFSSLLKSDLNLFSDAVFCFTPSGDVKNLPSGSTPIDFAYSIHSAVGNKMVGAKVNGKLVPIDYEIRNGDRIEVLTSQNAKGPSRDWLKYVRSSSAKNKINQWFRNESKDANIAKGKELLITSSKQKGIELSDINKPEYQEQIKNKYGFHSWEDTLAAIGQGAIKEGAVINRMYSSWQKDHPVKTTDADVLASIGDIEKEHKPKSKNGITVRGIDDLSVRFSKCCNPVPGDEIVGFVTRGRGVSIHRTDCINMINLPDFEKDRMIEAEWVGGIVQHQDSNETYLTEVNIYCNNRTGLLVDITRIFTEKDIDIDSIHSKTSKQGIATISVKFGIKGKDQLRALVEKIKQIDGIIDVERPRG